MKLLCLVVLCGMISISAAQAGSLEQLAGCWENRSAEHVYEEYWMKPAGNMILGVSRTSNSEKVIEYEYLQIITREDGTFYVANPSGQTKAEFKLTSGDGTDLVFENPNHDFPQKIVYRFHNNNSLVAWIEGISKGKPRKSEFPMQRVKCAE